MGKKLDDLLSFLSNLPGVTLVIVSKDDVAVMERPKDERLRQLHERLRQLHERLRQLHERGTVLHQKGHYAEAIKCFQEAIDLGFESCKAYLNIGVGYGKLKKWTEAVKWLRLAHAKFPNHEQISRNLAVAEQRASAKRKWWQFWN